MVEGEDVELSVVAEGHGTTFVERTGRSCCTSRLPSRAVKPNFTGPSYTLGIEEELMILDRDSWDLANAIEDLLSDSGAPVDGDDLGGIKPELHESVLEIATQAVRGHTRGRRRAARPAPPGGRDRRRAQPHDRLRGHAPVRALGGPADLRPPALPRPDRRAALRRAPGGHLRAARARRDRRRRQGDPRRQRDARARPGAARAVGQLAVLARPGRPASPRRGCRSSASSRASGCRPPTTTGRTSRSGSASWSAPKTIEDYTYLWYDVRPHPNFGTVEIRAMDGQTRVEHTLGLAALIQAMVKELAEHYEAGEQLAAYPYEMLDENRWIAARHGLEGEMVDLPGFERVADEGARAAALRPARRARAGPRLRHGPRGHRRPARARQRRASPAGGLRGQPRSSRGRARDRRSQRPGIAGGVDSVGWRVVPSSSSSARNATPRCPRTSRSARTAARVCASAHPSSTRAGARAPRAAASGRS